MLHISRSISACHPRKPVLASSVVSRKNTVTLLSFFSMFRFSKCVAYLEPVCVLWFLSFMPSIGFSQSLQSFSICASLYPLTSPSINSFLLIYPPVLLAVCPLAHSIGGHYNNCRLFCNVPCSVTAQYLHMQRRISNNDSINTGIERAAAAVTGFAAEMMRIMTQWGGWD